MPDRTQKSDKRRTQTKPAIEVVTPDPQRFSFVPCTRSGAQVQPDPRPTRSIHPPTRSIPSHVRWRKTPTGMHGHAKASDRADIPPAAKGSAKRRTAAAAAVQKSSSSWNHNGCVTWT